jgi:hypothetical protein
MSKEEIIQDWLKRHNLELPTIQYSKCIFEFIENNASCYSYIYPPPTEEVKIYYFNGIYQKITQKTN